MTETITSSPDTLLLLNLQTKLKETLIDAPSSVRAIADVLFWFYEKNKNVVRPKFKWFMKKLGYGKTTISKALKYLIKLRFLKVISKGRGGNRYILFPEIQTEEYPKEAEKTVDNSCLQNDEVNHKCSNSEPIVNHKWSILGGHSIIIEESNNLINIEEESCGNVQASDPSPKSRSGSKVDLINIYKEKSETESVQDVISKSEGYQFYDQKNKVLCPSTLLRWVTDYGFCAVAGVLRAYELEYARKINENSKLCFTNGEAWCEKMIKNSKWKSVVAREINKFSALETMKEKSKRFIKRVAKGLAELVNGGSLELNMHPDDFNDYLLHYKKLHEQCVSEQDNDLYDYESSHYE